MEDLLDILNKIFKTTFFKVGAAEFSLLSILYTLALFVALFVVSSRIRSWVLMRIEASSPAEAGSLRSIAKIVHRAVVVIGAVIIFQTTGIDLSAFTVLVGAVGIGVGFGLQAIISNFFSGLIILFERPIKVGDRIEVGSVTGEVRDVSIRATTVVTNDNIAVIVPNSEFISSTVVNWSFTDKSVRFKFKVGVSYNSDPHKVKELLLKVAEGQPGILKNPAPTVIFDEFGESSLDFVLYAWTEEYYNRPGVLRSAVNLAVWDTFKKHNIEIPFPQRDVHIRSTVEKG